jgi:hypothetical protein
MPDSGCGACSYRGRRPSVAEPLEPLQGECAGSLLDPNHGSSQVVMQFVIWGVVCPLKGKTAHIGKIQLQIS